MALGVSQELVGDLKTIIMEGDRWRRVVFVVHKDDNIMIDFADGLQDSNKLKITLIPGGAPVPPPGGGALP